MQIVSLNRMFGSRCDRYAARWRIKNIAALTHSSRYFSFYVLYALLPEQLV